MCETPGATRRARVAEHQQACLLAVATAIRAGRPPSLREIQQALGDRSLSTVVRSLAQLRAQGLLRWERRRARTVRLTPRGWEALATPLDPATIPPPGVPWPELLRQVVRRGGAISFEYV